MAPAITGAPRYRWRPALFTTEIERRGIAAVAALVGEPEHVVTAWLAGCAVDTDARPGIATLFGLPADVLFRLDPHLERALATAGSRHVTNPATLRAVDAIRAAA